MKVGEQVGRSSRFHHLVPCAVAELLITFNQVDRVSGYLL